MLWGLDFKGNDGSTYAPTNSCRNYNIPLFQRIPFFCPGNEKLCQAQFKLMPMEWWLRNGFLFAFRLQACVLLLLNSVVWERELLCVMNPLPLLFCWLILLLNTQSSHICLPKLSGPHVVTFWSVLLSGLNSSLCETALCYIQAVRMIPNGDSSTIPSLICRSIF